MQFINEYGLAFGWTLIHMAWITLAIAVGVQLIRLVVRSPRFSYVLGMLSLLSLPIIATVIFGNQIDFSEPSGAIIGNGGFLELVQVFVGAEDSGVFTIGNWIDQHMDWILVLWFAGMISFIVRLLFGYTALVGFRQSIEPMSDYWNDRFQSILKEFNINANVIFGVSKRIDGPMTFGFIKPMILLPIGLVNSLSVDEVEAIIRHELAHIARHDYVFKMIQSAIESLFYYTPGTWWLTKMIDIDREQCCDDYAIRSGSSAAAYVNALYKVNTFNTLESQLALGFGKEKNQLLNRVKRILKQPQEKANIMGRLIIPIILLLVVAGVSINATFKDNEPEIGTVAVTATPQFNDAQLDAPQVTTVADADTTRPKSKSKSVTKSSVNANGKSYSVTRENGEITKMKVDGKKIDPKDYHMYEDKDQENRRSDGFHFDLDTDDMTAEEKAEFEDKMEKFGEQLEKSFGPEFEKNMEQFGERIEKWGEDLEENGGWDDFAQGMAKWGENFGKSFGEDFGKGMAEWGEAFGKEFADGFAFNFNDEEMENWGDQMEEWGESVEKRVEEYRLKHPEKFYQGGDGEWHLKNDNLTFEESEEIFGKGWTNNLTDGITKMMEGFNMPNIPVPPVMGNIPTPPAPPAFRNAPTPPVAPAASFKLELKELKSTLQADGFFKDNSKVTFQMDDNTLKINGKTQSDKVYKKYKKVIENNWGDNYLDDYEIDFNIIDKKAKKKVSGTYRI